MRLNVPPPLDTPLTVVERDGDMVAKDGDTVVMSAKRATADFGSAPFVGFDTAAASEPGYPGFKWHGADRCFVCGPARQDEHALRLFPGPVGNEQIVAAPWVPAPAVADQDGVVPAAVVWGALDCPGAWAATAHDPVGMPYFPTLGTMTASLDQPVHVGERMVLVARYRRTEGRKLFTDVVLYSEDGSVKARSRHIEIKLFEYDTTR